MTIKPIVKARAVLLLEEHARDSVQKILEGTPEIGPLEILEALDANLREAQRQFDMAMLNG